MGDQQQHFGGSLMSAVSRRVMPALLMDQARLVKTRSFRRPVYVGDPINTIRVFNDKGCDELLLLDIGAGRRESGPDIDTIRAVASECFMPLAYGGGITSVAHAEALFACGVEKIVVRSAAQQDPSLITKLATRFGSQAVVVAIDVDRSRSGELVGFGERGSKTPGRIAMQSRLTRAVESGAGEVMVQSVKADGNLEGPDSEVADLLRGLAVPTIYGGGIASDDDMRSVFAMGIDAVAVGAHFVLYGPHRAVLITYPTRDELAGIGVIDEP